MLSDRLRKLVVSIVIYGDDDPLLHQTVKSLKQAAVNATVSESVLSVVELILIDNGPDDGHRSFIGALASDFSTDDVLFSKVISGHGNIGFGRGHNLAIFNIPHSDNEYHLILNPDVLIDPLALKNSIQFLSNHPEVGMVAPAKCLSHWKLD